MGGYGSGYRGQPKQTADASKRININTLDLTPGLFNVLSWSCRGQHVGSVGYTVCNDSLRFDYTVTPYDAPDKPIKFDYHVYIERCPRHFGGCQNYFLCPQCTRRCAVIYMPDGARKFACRHCHDLNYNCQQQTKTSATMAALLGMSLEQARALDSMYRHMNKARARA